jgi:hypothetical protein
MLGILAFSQWRKGAQECKAYSSLKFKKIKLINAGSNMVLEASVLGLHAPMEYGLIPGPSQGSSDYTHLAVCWISGPGASWCRLVAWRVVMARKVVSGTLCRLARASCSFCQMVVPFNLGLLPSTQSGEMLQYLGSLACA